MTIDIGELIVSDNATLEVATPNPTDVAMVDTLDLSNGAVLTHRAATTTDEYTLRLLADTVTVDATSSIDVSARGYLPGHTLGNTTVGAATGWAGGSYAGEGVGDTNETYGDYRDPNELGSGGSADYAGLAGGGLVRIDANTLQLDGTIRADGGQGTVQGHSRAAGSGGGIKIDVGTLSGSGLISAKGGSEWWNGDQSGGGRIAVYFDTNTGFNLDNKVTTAAGGSVYDPSPGTVYIEQNGGEKLLRIFSPEIPPGAKTPIPGSMLEVDRLIVSGKNVYAMPKDTMSINVEELTVSDGATFEVALPDFNDTFTVATVDLLGGGVLTHRAATATQEFALRMTVDTLTIDATSAVDATNRGYMAGHTYGNTTIRAATGIAGGSYGATWGKPSETRPTGSTATTEIPTNSAPGAAATSVIKAAAWCGSSPTPSTSTAQYAPTENRLAPAAMTGLHPAAAAESDSMLEPFAAPAQSLLSVAGADGTAARAAGGELPSTTIPSTALTWATSPRSAGAKGPPATTTPERPEPSTWFPPAGLTSSGLPANIDLPLHGHLSQ